MARPLRFLPTPSVAEEAQQQRCMPRIRERMFNIPINPDFSTEPVLFCAGCSVRA
jgi:hypothetical protein